MKTRTKLSLVFGAAGLAMVLGIFEVAGQGQGAPAQSSYKAARSAYKDGKPDLNGVWQTFTTANWDIQDHGAKMGPVPSLGAVFSVPPGQGIVVGGEIPYLPAAAAKKKENAGKWLTDDPEIKCYLPGVPRITYMPYPFQIIQGQDHILISYEFTSASRLIYMDKSTPEAPFDSWLGWSRGRWEGDTLVVDVEGFNGLSNWLDRAGNFTSEALKVTERYTPVSPDHIRYDVTLTDPKVFSRPLQLSLVLYRRKEANIQPMEYKCVEFVEEMMYGPYSKKQTN